jgi:hypothetical protein
MFSSADEGSRCMVRPERVHDRIADIAAALREHLGEPA